MSFLRSQNIFPALRTFGLKLLGLHLEREKCLVPFSPQEIRAEWPTTGPEGSRAGGKAGPAPHSCTSC